MLTEQETSDMHAFVTELEDRWAGVDNSAGLHTSAAVEIS